MCSLIALLSFIQIKREVSVRWEKIRKRLLSVNFS